MFDLEETRRRFKVELEALKHVHTQEALDEAKERLHKTRAILMRKDPEFLAFVASRRKRFLRETSLNEKKLGWREEVMSREKKAGVPSQQEKIDKLNNPYHLPKYGVWKE